MARLPGYHLVLRLGSTAVTVAHRRRFSHAIARLGRSYGLIAFRLIGDTVQAIVTCGRRQAGRFAAALPVALRAHLSLAPGRARIIPLWGPSQLRGAVERLLWDVDPDDPYCEGGMLPDLWGARLDVCTDLVGGVRETVPELAIVPPWGSGSTRPPTLEELVVAVEAAAGISSLRGRSRIHRAWRPALVAAAPPRVSLAELAGALGCGVRAAIRAEQAAVTERSPAFAA